MKILLVEDSERLRRALSQGLSQSGFVVDAVADGEEGLAFALAGEYDAIVLDLMLPRLSGLGVLQGLRECANATRVLVLSARDQVEDRILSLDRGADDYLVKPFAFDELVARLHALERRSRGRATPKILAGELEIEVARHETRYQGAVVVLTAGEQMALEILLSRRGRVVSKRNLLDLLHGADDSVSDNAVEVLISSLRRKLREAGVPPLVVTRRRYGYLVP